MKPCEASPGQPALMGLMVRPPVGQPGFRLQDASHYGYSSGLDGLRERGYDQALELGRDIACELGVALSPDLLRRGRATPAQAGLDARGRRRNVRGAFKVNPRAGDGALPDRKRSA